MSSEEKPTSVENEQATSNSEAQPEMSEKAKKKAAAKAAKKAAKEEAKRRRAEEQAAKEAEAEAKLLEEMAEYKEQFGTLPVHMSQEEYPQYTLTPMEALFVGNAGCGCGGSCTCENCGSSCGAKKACCGTDACKCGEEKACCGQSSSSSSSSSSSGAGECCGTDACKCGANCNCEKNTKGCCGEEGECCCGTDACKCGANCGCSKKTKGCCGTGAANSLVGQSVVVRGRIATVRKSSSKLAFIMLRSGFHELQCVLASIDEDAEQETYVPPIMIKYATRLKTEALVDVHGVVAEATDSTSVAVELKVHKVFVVADVAASEYPLTVIDASRSEEDVRAAEAEGKSVPGVVGQDIRLDNRWLDLRTKANQGIFRLQAALKKLFREYLDEQGFVEITTPKIIGQESEGGAGVFHVDYFNTTACLAQSPQFYKQMAISCDLKRVYEIGPMFRAENANTGRHLTEFTGMDLEMEIDIHYHEVLRLMANMFTYIFDGLYARYGDLVEHVNAQFPAEPVRYRVPEGVEVAEEDGEIMNGVLVLNFPAGVRMLREAGAKTIDGSDIGDLEDLETPTEKLLGELVANKYQVDFYVLDKYPTVVRPFYTMPDPKDANYSNSYDIMLRNQEIMSGAQRIHDKDMLVYNAQNHPNEKKRIMDVSTIGEYVDSFSYGTSPHGGGGVGMERILMLFLGLGNIRQSSMFPRDPHRLAP